MEQQVENQHEEQIHHGEMDEIQEGEQPQVQINYEERARMQGWVPKEEFRGDPSKHITAQEFVERADTIMPILKATNKKLETKLEEVERKLAEKDETLNRIVKVQKKYGDDTYSQRINEIEEKKRQAVRDGDEELYDRLTKQQSEIKPPENIEIETPKNNEQISQANFQRWVSENEWFNKDEEMRDWAIAYGDVLAKKNHELAVPGKEYEFGEYVKSKMKNAMPHKFTNPAQNTSEFDTSNTRGNEFNTGKTKGWNDLPDAAKQDCINMENSIPGFTREKYIKTYFED